MLDEKTLTYNALDSAVTFECYEAFWQRFLGQSYEQTYNMTTRIMGPLLFMMHRGIRVDREELEVQRKRTREQIERLQAALNQEAGRPLNPMSPKDCQRYFYGELGIKPFTKKGANGKQTITTDDKAMQRLAVGSATRKPIKAAKLVQELRGLHKLLGTYLEIEFDPDGRFRCAVNPRGTVTGRISTGKTIYGTGMNMQNLPLQFKRFLVPDPGMVFIEIDLAGAEWVVVAYLAQDPNMIRVVETGADPHVATAEMMFGVPAEVIVRENKLIGHETDPVRITKLRAQVPEVHQASFLPRTMSLRQAAKKANHGLNYDEGPRMFAFTNEIAEFEAKRLIDLYHRAYPNIRSRFHAHVQELMRTSRTIVNAFGRKRRFIGAYGPELLKAAYAHEPQSTVSDNLNIGMCNAYEDRSPLLSDCELLAQVHDSLLAQAPAGDPERLAEVILTLKQHMRLPITVHGRTFYLKTDVKLGMNWADMTELPQTDDKAALIAAIVEALP